MEILALTVPATARQPPTPVSPTGQIHSSCPTFSWSAATGADGYEIVVYAVDEDGEVGTTPLVSKRLPAGTNAWTPAIETCLQAGGSYAWSLRAIGSEIGAEWSDAALFRVPSNPSIDEVERAIRTLRRYLAQGKQEHASEGQSTLSGEPPARSSARLQEPPRREALRSDTASKSLLPRAVSPPGSYALSIDGDFDLGGFVFKDGYPFLHNDGGPLFFNTALGLEALVSATPGAPFSNSGSYNTALGDSALSANTSGSSNTATGFKALTANTTGDENTATGYSALSSNTEGYSNTALGEAALINNTTGFRNTGAGANSLHSNTTGNRNIAVGYQAGQDNTTGSDNIWIGSDGALESNTLRIGSGSGTGNFQQARAFISGIRDATVTGSTVLVSADDQVGVSSSSRRFKEEIEELGDVAERLLELEPVTFRYRPEMVSGGGDPEVGLIAEEVAEVFPELVTRDAEGQPFGVRYDLLSVVLLEEIQRQNRVMERQDHANAQELKALRERLTSLEEGRPRSAERTPWWRRIFGTGRSSP